MSSAELFALIALATVGTFTPGPNSGCVPATLFRGVNSVSPEAAAWITTPTTSRTAASSVRSTSSTDSWMNSVGL